MPRALVWSKGGTREQLRPTAEKAEGDATSPVGGTRSRNQRHIEVMGEESPGARRHRRWAE